MKIGKVIELIEWMATRELSEGRKNASEVLNVASIALHKQIDLVDRIMEISMTPNRVMYTKGEVLELLNDLYIDSEVNK